MAQTKCGFCEQRTGFEACEEPVQRSKTKTVLIKCITCGSVVSAMEWVPTGDLYAKLEIIEKKLDRKF